MKKLMLAITLTTAATALIYEAQTTRPFEAEKYNLSLDSLREGKTALKGIDRDGDGVRDDVQRAIHERQPSDNTKRDSLKQFAKAIQEAIIAGSLNDPAITREAAGKVISGVDCIHSTFTDATEEIVFIESKVANTKQRATAYMKFNQANSGLFFTHNPDTIPCTNKKRPK